MTRWARQIPPTAYYGGRNVTAVTFGCYVLANGFDCFTGNDFCSDGRLYGDVELLSRNEFLKFFAHAPAEGNAVVEVRESRKSIDRLTVKQNIEFDEFARPVIVQMVVERRISFRNALQFVVKVDHDFAQREIVEKLDSVTGNVILFDENTALTKAECHNRSDIRRLCDDGSPDKRFLDMVDLGGIGQAAGVVYFGTESFFIVHFVRYVRNGRNYIHVELAKEFF